MEVHKKSRGRAIAVIVFCVALAGVFAWAMIEINSFLLTGQ